MQKRQSRTPKKSSKTLRTVPNGRVYITATFNNTLVSVTDEQGNVLCWASTGGAGFSGSRKPTPDAATVTVATLATAGKVGFAPNKVIGAVSDRKYKGIFITA